MNASALSRAAAQLMCLGLLTLLALVLPAPAHADNGGLGFRVDNTEGSVLTAGYIRLTAAPGGSTGGHFIATNTEDVAVQLAIYPADGLTGATTGVVYGDQDDAIVSAGGWITPSINSALVPAHSERQVDFSVSVPGDATAGDHVGSVVLQQTRPGSKATGQISQVVRNVIPILIDVPGAASPQVVVRAASITFLPGTTLHAVTVSLRNNGLRMCQPALAVALEGPSEGGQAVTRQLDTILPGDRAPYPLPWPKKIASGSYLVNVTASGCGATRTFKVTAKTPDDPEADGPDKAAGGGKKGPALVTDASPGTTRFEAPSDAEQGSGQGGKSTKKRKNKDRGDQNGANAAGGGVPPGSGGGGPGSDATLGRTATSGAEGGSSWLSKAAQAVKINAPAVLERATVPLLVLALIGLIFIVQEAIDRRDPKLALAPLHREPHLPFDSNPLATRSVIPSPTLAPGSG